MRFNPYDEKYKEYAHQLVEQLAGNGLTVEESLFVVDIAKQEIQEFSNGQLLTAQAGSGKTRFSFEVDGHRFAEILVPKDDTGQD